MAKQWPSFDSILLFATLLLLSKCSSSSSSSSVTVLSESRASANVPSVEDSPRDELQVFCYNGVEARLTLFWRSVHIRVHMETNEPRRNDETDKPYYYNSNHFSDEDDERSFDMFVGENVSQVEKLYTDHKSSWLSSSLAWKATQIRLPPFQSSCVGIASIQSFTVELISWNVDLTQFGMTMIGILLFYTASKLCRNAFFHYSSGVLLGVLTSTLILTYLLQRKARATWFGWIFGVYSLATYLMTSLWLNINNYIVEHSYLIFSYVVVTGLLSFAFCYRMGPIEDVRSLNLLQWSLQLLALLVIFFSSYYQKASAVLAVTLLLHVSMPERLRRKVSLGAIKNRLKKGLRRGGYPISPPRLLSESEYLEASRVETERSLKELRSFCNSPQCNAWSVTSRLSSPSRFAEFVQGEQNFSRGSHLSQEEVINHSHFEDDEENSRVNNLNITDDDDNDDDDDVLLNGDINDDTDYAYDSHRSK